jgi:hypothetical protein
MVILKNLEPALALNDVMFAFSTPSDYRFLVAPPGTRKCCSREPTCGATEKSAIRTPVLICVVTPGLGNIPVVARQSDIPSTHIPRDLFPFMISTAIEVT